MRSFIISVLLFMLIAGAVTVNSLYVNSTLNKISSAAEQLSSAPSSERIDELKDLWYSSQDLLGISVKESKLERMSELIEALAAAHRVNNTEEFKKLCVLISLLCEEMTQYERILLQSII